MKILIRLLLALSLNYGLINAAQLETSFAYYPEELAEAIQALELRPEMDEISTLFNGKKKITILYMPMEGEELEAFWDGGARQIRVNSNNDPALGRLIGTILFEFHNAKNNHKLVYITQQAIDGKITKEQYVRSVEELEFNNARQTYEILEKGIADGHFPKSAHWPLYNNFEDHYRVQQLMAHSDWLANYYNRLNPAGAGQKFKGTIKDKDRMSAADKKVYLRYLGIKHSLNEGNAKAVEVLRQEQEKADARQAAWLLEIFN